MIGVGLGVVAKRRYSGFPPPLRSFWQRVRDDGGTMYDYNAAIAAYRLAPTASLVWAASASKEAVDYSVLPADGSGDFTYSGGGNAVSQRPDGLWQVGWPANTPRNSYLDGVLGRLVEPQRQLLITHPRLFSNAAWTLTNATILGGFACPFVNNLGVNTNEGYKFVATAANAILNLTTAHTSIAASTYTNSVFLKRINGTGQVSILDVNNVARPITITNEWQRYEYAAVALTTSGQIGIQLATSGDEVMVCHAQPELGATSTSPIYGTEGGVIVRVADNITKTGASALIGQTEGTILVDVFFNIFSLQTFQIISLQGSTTANYLYMYVFDTNKVRVAVKQSGGSETVIMTSSSSHNVGRHKIALGYKSGDYVLAINGAIVGTSNSIVFPTELTSLIISNSVFLYGNKGYYKIFLDKNKMSNIQLQQLTTL
jgi:hypothetical protein